MKHDVKDLSLANEGRRRIEWAAENMPVLGLLRSRFRKQKPLAGVRLGCCLHVTTETANLMLALKDAGAGVALCASNPLSTQDDVAASLVKHHRVPVFAVKGENKSTYYRHINSVLDTRPQITMDDGADLVSAVHGRRRELAAGIIGGTEETTTGVIRLRSLEKQGLLLFPLVAVNDAATKRFFDNRYGTGQSTMDGILRATNRLIAGSTVVVCGYGWCGRGVAMRARGLGGRVIVTEVDPLKALEAVMDGYQVMPIAEAAGIGDVFVTLTGDVKAIGRKHFIRMKDGAIVCNSGHFNVELDLDGLRSLAVKRRRARESVEEYTLKNGRRINVLGEGRLVNLAAAEGHPACVMDMSFADQALSAVYLAKEGAELERRVYRVPQRLDDEVARLKLRSLKIRIDKLTPEQKRYLSSWELGT